VVVTEQTINHHHWTIKFATGFHATGQMMANSGKCPTPVCPKCGHIPEITSHIVQCPEMPPPPPQTGTPTTFNFESFFLITT